MRGCSADGCTKTNLRARGLCRSHYEQWRRGEPLVPIRRWHIGSDREVFYSYVTPSEGCWVWQGPLIVPSRGGYGVMKGRKAHRVSYELHHGPIPNGLFVCHTCDNPPCVNPEHLFLGTNADNTADKTSKRRTYMRLSDADVARMRRFRAYGLPTRTIARLFGVTRGHTSRILNGHLR